MTPLLIPVIDAFLLRAFRFRTRRFLCMEDASCAIPSPLASSSRGSLYLHIPFCEKLCPFCSFHRLQHHRPQAQRYFRCLREEIHRYHEAGFQFSSAYFGGGTPTTEPEGLVETVNLVRNLFNVRDISIETNPRDLRPEILEPLRSAGVTRLSVGVQSFDDRLLKEMDRYESYGSSAEAHEHLQKAAGLFPTLNVDLIFNLPHQDLASLERDLRIFRASGANQVSFYPLMTSPSVVKKLAAATGLPGRRKLYSFYKTILASVTPEFTPSSAWCFTRQGQTSDEYIVDADFYVGVGSGAFSYLGGTLYATTFSLDAYEKRIAEGLTGVTVQSHLSETDQMRYSLLVKMFGLRLDREWALRRYGPRFFRRLWAELLTLECLGAARRDDRGWQLTERGMYWLMLMMSAFFESVAQYREFIRAYLPRGPIFSSHSSETVSPEMVVDRPLVRIG
jgi:coproporphyrinogen III oxidase-like Fe-S oxidoreductase